MRAAAHEADGIAANYPHDDRSYRRWHGTAGLLCAQAALMRALSLMSLYAFDQIPDGEAIACGMFLLVLAVAEILSKAVGLHPSATVVFSTSIALAVLAGFGVPGLVALRGGSGKEAGGDG
jgi:hypothetical protein